MRPNFSRGSVRLLATAATVVLAALFAGVAMASSAKVVPPKGQVAGRGYPDWLAKWWQVGLRTPPGGSICQRVGKVEVLIGTPFSKGPNRCTIPAGRAVYINGPSAECSTLEKPPYHGDTDTELKSCARRNFAGISKTKLTIDGHVLRHVGRWVVASPVFQFHVPKKNMPGSKGRSAAYGSGFLLRRPSPGRHVVHATGEEAGHPVALTYRIVVKPAN